MKIKFKDNSVLNTFFFLIIMSSISCINEIHDDRTINNFIGEWINIHLKGYVDVPYITITQNQNKILVTYPKRRGQNYEVKIEIGILKGNELILDNNNKILLLEGDTIHFGNSLFSKIRKSEVSDSSQIWKKGIYQDLVAAYGDDYSISEFDFLKNISFNEQFIKDTYINLKEASGDDFKLSEEEFMNRCLH